MTVYFKKLRTAYVQTGMVTTTRSFVEGQHYVQGLENIVDTVVTKTYPDSWSAEWATLSTPTDAEDRGWDVGAYGVGVKPSYAYSTDYARVKEVTLMLQIVHNGTAESFNTVYYEGDDSSFVDNLVDKIYTDEEYVDLVNLQGFNSWGADIFRYFPAGVVHCNVDELRSIKGSFVDLDGNVIADTAEVLLAPFYVGQMFGPGSELYLAVDGLYDFKGDKIEAKDTLIPPRLIKIRGGLPSENRAFMGFDDDSVQTTLAADGSIGGTAQGSDPTGADLPLVEDQLVIDGITYTHTDAYNLTRRLN